jgi:hypothetical protein
MNGVFPAHANRIEGVKINSGCPQAYRKITETKLLGGCGVFSTACFFNKIFE